MKYHAWVNADFLLEKCLVGVLDVPLKWYPAHFTAFTKYWHVHLNQFSYPLVSLLQLGRLSHLDDLDILFLHRGLSSRPLQMHKLLNFAMRSVLPILFSPGVHVGFVWFLDSPKLVIRLMECLHRQILPVLSNLAALLRVCSVHLWSIHCHHSVIQFLVGVMHI